MNWSLDTSLLIPQSAFLAALAVALVLIAFLFWRRARGAALRAIALTALLLALANPTLRQEERQGLANVAIVVVDESASMALARRPEEAAEIKRQLDAKLDAIPNLDLRTVMSSRPTGESASGTQLFADLNRALTDVPVDRLAGVILITDGQVHDVPASAAALGFDAPVHAILVGRPNEFDRRIEILTAPKYGIVGQTRDITLRVVETGSRPQVAASQLATLRIRREGRPDELRRTAIGRNLQVAMPFPHAGQNIVEIELDQVDGELTAANNRIIVSAEGVRENLRVLLVSGEPHAGERTWRNLLKSDAAVDLVHFTILRPPIKQDGTPIHQLSLIAFPTRELFSEKINDFDLIILDRYQNRDNILDIRYYDNIAKYVEGGGALLVSVGDDYIGPASLARTLLAPVLPGLPTGRLMERGFKPKLSSDGVKHPVTRDLPGAMDGSGSTNTPSWGQWYRQGDIQTSRGRTLLNGADDRPLLVLDRTGKGRVALMTSDHAWLWARGYDGGGPHTQLLRRISHWLMKEPDLEEERLLGSARGLKLTIERRTMENRVAPVDISAPGGETMTVSLDQVGEGHFRTIIDVKTPGLYKLQSPSAIGILTAVAHAGIEDQREMSEVVATEAKLKGLVDSTGGGIFWANRGGTLFTAASGSIETPRVSILQGARVLAGSGWLGLRDREAYVTTGVKVTPMFTGLLALLALLAMITAAWWREGR